MNYYRGYKILFLMFGVAIFAAGTISLIIDPPWLNNKEFRENWGAWSIVEFITLVVWVESIIIGAFVGVSSSVKAFSRRFHGADGVLEEEFPIRKK